MGNVFFLSKVTLRMLKNVRLPRRSAPEGRAPRNDKGCKDHAEETILC